MSNLHQQTDLEEAITRVVVFFNMFDFPLTGFEIWKLIDMKCGLDEINSALVAAGKTETKNGFYFLRGREKCVETRLARYNHTDRKFKRALKISRVFKFIPWIKMIAIGNIMGPNNMKDGGDIDFFIISSANRIWLARFFCVFAAKILNLRPRPEDARDKICLSFYISEDAMDARNLMLPENIFPDIYFIYWLANLAPIFDRGGTYEKFIEKNSWLKEYLPNWRLFIPAERRIVKDAMPPLYAHTAEFFFHRAENVFKRIQLYIMPLILKKNMNQGGAVIINDRILKLHVNDRREEYRKKYAENIITIK